MEVPALVELACTQAAGTLGGAMPPALLPLPRTPVTAEVWSGERHVRLHGEAIYAVHKGDGRAWWAVVVHESNHLEAGSVHLVALEEIRCENPSGRRG
ncbi:MAG: hypothetical protein MUE51_15000 [Thermoleophilia bacterium]|jgi:hypothetical protein|nr:hypothetical protein [Thermoleophilia bacterium]